MPEANISIDIKLVEMFCFIQTKKIDFLKSLIKEEIDELLTIQEQISLISAADFVKEEHTDKAMKNMKQVFVVYGHDKLMKLEVEAYLRDSLMLDIVALDEKPNRNWTIIEKFEHYSKDAGFAVILMSPDDTMKVDGQIYKQARQNVVLELGYFMAKLGRGDVCVLVKGDVERPTSDRIQTKGLRNMDISLHGLKVVLICETRMPIVNSNERKNGLSYILFK